MFINRYIDKEDIYIYIHNCTLMELEGFMLTEANQRKTNAVYFHLYVKYKKNKIQANITEQKQTHR